MSSYIELPPQDMNGLSEIHFQPNRKSYISSHLVK